MEGRCEEGRKEGREGKGRKGKERKGGRKEGRKDDMRALLPYCDKTTKVDDMAHHLCRYKKVDGMAHQLLRLVLRYYCYRCML